MERSASGQQRDALPIDLSPDRQPGIEGLGSLVGGIVENLQGIMRGEIRLAKTELREDLSTMGQGVTALVIGARLALVGFIFLMLGLTYLLNESIEMWQAAGIVGLALLVIGGIAVMAGKKRLSAVSLTPTQTVDSLKENRQGASQQIKSVKN